MYAIAGKLLKGSFSKFRDPKNLEVDSINTPHWTRDSIFYQIACKKMSEYLPIRDSSSSSRKKRKQLFVSNASVIIVSILSFLLYVTLESSPPQHSRCGCYKPLSPAFNVSLNEILYDAGFKESVVKKLVGTIKIPTGIRFYSRAIN